ncbi:MAG: helix-turn-helix domain-containing protein [Kiritimatiellae bacterium]|nr:helix-turn-helix domain-containing protein [Kiritimatiellia bacterium]
MKDKPDNLLLRRGVRVLDALAGAHGPLRFGQVQKLLAPISPSSVASVLGTLRETGVVRKRADGGYALSERVRFWARGAQRRPSLEAIARPHMARLSGELQATVILFAFCGETMQCLHSELDPASPSLARPGSALPARLDVIGSIFIGDWLARGRDEELLRLLRFDPARHRRALVDRILARARREGYMYDEAVFYAGSHRFSVPIRCGAETPGILGLGCTAQRLKEKGFKKRMLTALKQTAERIAEELTL